VVHQKRGNLVIGCTLTCTLYGLIVLVCFWHLRCQLYCDFRNGQLQAKFAGLNQARSRTSDGSLVRITSSCASCIGPVVWVRWWLCPTHNLWNVGFLYEVFARPVPHRWHLAFWWPSEYWNYELSANGGVLFSWSAVNPAVTFDESVPG
jgi:hypothetical protein